jgi:tRNA(Ile2)-agmatinylcytidine synthase
LRLHVGLDDTDSPQGGCTTYIAARLVERLLEIGTRFVDYPNLLRLNPNVPWKTRGNGAVCLRVEIDEEQARAVKRAVVGEVEAGSRFECGNTNPGMVFLEGEVP